MTDTDVLALDEVLDALELMVQQYLESDGGDPAEQLAALRPVAYDHAFMSAGERALAVLALMRPDRWTLCPCGAERVGPPVIPGFARRDLPRQLQDWRSS